MKKLLLSIFLMASPLLAEGPILKHQDTIEQQEFEHVYGDLRAKIQSSKVLGTTTNDDACQACVGYYASSFTAAYANYPANGVWGQLVTLTLPAGDWEVRGHVLSGANGATCTEFSMGITPTSGNVTPTFPNLVTYSGPTAATNTSGTHEGIRFSVATSSTVYLKYQGNFSAATPVAKGFLEAWRKR